MFIETPRAIIYPIYPVIRGLHAKQSICVYMFLLQNMCISCVIYNFSF